MLVLQLLRTLAMGQILGLYHLRSWRRFLLSHRFPHLAAAGDQTAEICSSLLDGLFVVHDWVRRYKQLGPNSSRHLKSPSSFSILQGPVAHMQHMLGTQRLPFTAAYVVTLALSLYFAIAVSPVFPWHAILPLR